ncbi:MAG: hypothetical protein ACFFCW_11615 [Candidatus Hodarchaeota archaeon]
MPPQLGNGESTLDVHNFKLGSEENFSNVDATAGRYCSLASAKMGEEGRLGMVFSVITWSQKRVVRKKTVLFISH